MQCSDSFSLDGRSRMLVRPRLCVAKGVQHESGRRSRGVGKTTARAPGAMTALDGLDAAVPAGEFVSITGPSGCGKSTVLNLVAGSTTLRPDACWSRTGTSPRCRNGRAAAAAALDRIHLQSFNLLPRLTVERNVAWRLERPARRACARRRARAGRRRSTVRWPRYPSEPRVASSSVAAARARSPPSRAPAARRRADRQPRFRERRIDPRPADVSISSVARR